MNGYQKAIALLHKASTPNGFVAAVKEEDNYRRIWTRDSALCGLAALSTADEALKQTYQRSIETIFRHQHPKGFIPSNVSPLTEDVSYGSVVGRVDNHAWIIISACQYAVVQNKADWLSSYRPAIDKSFALMDAWEFNGRGLIYVPQSADWADEYYHQGYILYNQLLRLWAYRCAAAAFGNELYNEVANTLQTLIENYFSAKEYYAAQVERMWEEKPFEHWIMGFSTFTIYTQFDLAANVLALLLKIGTAEQQEATIAFLRKLLEGGTNILPSFYPVVKHEDDAMKELRNNFAYRFRNHPYEFHNGGLWPVWNGFAALALAGYASELSSVLRKRIESACSQQDWEFNECYHGQTAAPIGVPHCAWSAAGLILSHNTSFLSNLVL